jgi:carboxypeptidase C (cathepsin A)
LLVLAVSAAITVAEEASPRSETPNESAAEQAEAAKPNAPTQTPRDTADSQTKVGEPKGPTEAPSDSASDKVKAARPNAPAATPDDSGAREAQAAKEKESTEAQQQEHATAEPTLPSDAVTHHVLELPGRTLRFEATAGSIPLADADGRVQSRMAYVAYTLGGADAKLRPVAFAINGGPGASSAWLHLGALGPWRLPLDGDSARPSAVATTVPNAETWLDFADLVFIDPIGTGFSTIVRPPDAKPGAKGEAQRTSREDLQKRYWSVDGDIEALAGFVSKWTAKTGRYSSPKLLVGESYGGFRVPKLAHKLQNDYGVGTSLLVLVSPVLDFGLLRGHRHLPLNTVALLPSLAAAALEARGKTVSAAQQREAEEYARGDYLSDLMRGPRDKAAVERIIPRVAALTGLPGETVRRYGGRLDSFGYRREAGQDSSRIASAYDASVSGLNPEPTSPYARAEDPFMTAVLAPLTSAMLELYASKLGWRTDNRYHLINGDVSHQWRYGNSRSPPEVVSDLKATLALDPRLRVLVVHGYTDLVTPYFASTLVLDQLPAYGDARRVVQITYPGGHMFYSREAARSSFREDVLILLAASLSSEAQTR